MLSRDRRSQEAVLLKLLYRLKSSRKLVKMSIPRPGPSEIHYRSYELLGDSEQAFLIPVQW